MLPTRDESAEPLSEGQGRVLLDLARAALDAHLRRRGTPPVPDDPSLQRGGGVFVSLHRGDDLAGCIGFVESADPIGETVIRAAIAAGTGDPRFHPVELRDLPELRIEVSVLSSLRPLDDPGDVEIGRDGLLIEQRGRRGLLLPQVATSQGWGPEEFLQAVCDKAGLPADAWRRGASLRRFTAQVFSE